MMIFAVYLVFIILVQPSLLVASLTRLSADVPRYINFAFDS